ncbi:phosphatase PAP2 family protein [Amycolatopsis benzoatilytica]|uniref:phosphatase PAP2 family protein n=1 Tax=Amycolatopsis benzoatilytica TaxID=346045 RepID=UPI000380A1B6|nr:phosphatase PAP2 family protein [Amycolatopsis benzoatilytica]
MASTGGASGSATYDAVTAFALKTPGWVQALMLAYTSYGLVLVAPLFGWLWWRARKTGAPERMAAALLVPAGTVAAYLLSELVKAFVHEQRPCRGLPASAIVGTCPAAGDWSFPSNHSTIAAATALGAAFAWRRGAPWLALFAASMGFSRVFVGAHYPHDVLIGLALGAGMALLLQRYAVAPATTVVRRFAGRVPFGLLGVSPQPAAPGQSGFEPTQRPGPGFETPDARPARGTRSGQARGNAGPVREGGPARPVPARGPAARAANGAPVNEASPMHAPGTEAPPARSVDADPRQPRNRAPASGGNVPPAHHRDGTANPPRNPNPGRAGRSQQPRPAGPPARPAGQSPAGQSPEISPGDRPSRRTPGASRPTPPGRRTSRNNG